MQNKCNLCNSKKVEYFLTSHNIHGYTTIDNNEDFKLVRCSKCANIFIPNITVNSRYYKKYYLDDYYSVEFKSFIKNIVVKIVDFISYYMKKRLILHFSRNKSGIKILDIGCGTGGFLARLNSSIFNRNGLEINKNAVKIARKKGLNVNATDFLNSKTKDKYDVITMWQVLEHLNKPQDAVKKVYSMLNKGGIFVFGVPNSGSLGFKLGGKNWYHLDSPRHLFIPNESNLRLLLKKSNFTVEKVLSEWYDYPLDLFYSVKKSRFRYLIYPLYPIVKVFDKEVLTVIARKV